MANPMAMVTDVAGMMEMVVMETATMLDMVERVAMETATMLDIVFTETLTVDMETVMVPDTVAMEVATNRLNI